MAYSDFTLREAIDRFGLTLTDVPNLFGDAPEVEPGLLLRALLPEYHIRQLSKLVGILSLVVGG